MQRYTNVISTAPEVQPIEADEYHVYVNNGITALDDGDFTGYKIAEQLVYGKDEYITVIANKNAELSERTTEVEGTVNSILTDVLPNLMEV